MGADPIRKPTGSQLLVLILAAGAIGFWLRGCVAVDACLDRGGRWNEESRVCEGPVGAHP